MARQPGASMLCHCCAAIICCNTLCSLMSCVCVILLVSLKHAPVCLKDQIPIIDTVMQISCIVGALRLLQ